MIDTVLVSMLVSLLVCSRFIADTGACRFCGHTQTSFMRAKIFKLFESVAKDNFLRFTGETRLYQKIRNGFKPKFNTT